MDKEVKLVDYETMMKKHKRKLSAIVKADEDYSYQSLHDYIVQKIKNLYEYFTTCEDVVSEEEASVAEIVKSLEAIIKIDEDIKAEESRVVVELKPEELEVCSDGSLSEDPEGEPDADEDDAPATERGLTLEESNEKASKLDKLYKKFYKLIGDNLLTWWF